MPPRPKVWFLWDAMTGYWAGAFAALAKRADVTVVPRPTDPTAPYSPADLRAEGVDVRTPTWPPSARALRAELRRSRPDAVVSTGWDLKPFLRTLWGLPGVTRVAVLDRPWTGSRNQRLGALMSPAYVRTAYDRVFAAGQLQAEYARHLHFADRRIATGSIPCDVERFRLSAEPTESRREQPSFLFVGRLAPEKGVDTLLEGYQAYRGLVDEPWGLTICGNGPLEDRVIGAAGISRIPFTPPSELPGVYARAATFVLPSRYEPWGVVATEARASGLPLIASDGCGSVPELADGPGGWVFPAGDPCSLAHTMAAIHALPVADRLAAGASGPAIAADYTADRWAGTLLDLIARP